MSRHHRNPPCRPAGTIYIYSNLQSVTLQIRDKEPMEVDLAAAPFAQENPRARPVPKTIATRTCLH